MAIILITYTPSDRNNTNCGFTAHRSEQLLFTNCLFHDNNSSAFYNYTDALDPGGFRFAGGLLISWKSMDNESASNSAVVRNCTFLRNSAVVNVRNRNDSRPDFYRPRGHGGAIVLAFENVSDFTVTIEDSRILENTAVSSGGGVFISFYDTSTNNKVVITNTTFEENYCDQEGGAINVNTFEVANDNILIVEDSIFHQNRAKVGGGACSFNIQVVMSQLYFLTLCYRLCFSTGQLGAGRRSLNQQHCHIYKLHLYRKFITNGWKWRKLGIKLANRSDFGHH